MKKILPLNRFLNLLRLDKKDIYQVFFYAIFSGIISLSLPLGIQAIINLIQGGTVSASWIVLVVIVVIGVIFVGLLRLMQMRITENLQQKIFIRSSFEFAFRFPKIKFEALHNNYPPELANRFFDTLTIQKGVSKMILDYSASVLQIIFSLILLSLYHPFFIIFGIMLFILLYLIFRISFDEGLRSSLKESKYKYKVAHWLQEIARNNVSFKNENHHKYALLRNNDYINEYIKSRDKHFTVLIKQYSQLIGFKAVLTASLLLIGGLLVINEQMNIGQFVAAEIIIIGVISSVEKIILGLEDLYDVITSIEKVGQIVDMELEKEIKSKNIPSLDNNIKVELDNVSYHFPDDKSLILNNVSLTINPKDKIFINGRNSSGKTTLLKILSGLIEPVNGLFYVNDNNFNKISLADYRNHIGDITTIQSTFDGTIIENITFNDPSITNEDLKWAIDNVKLNDYIKSHPLGLDAPVFPDGKHLPSSITQKIVLARTIIHKPKFLILEDPLDKLDLDQANEIIDFLTDPIHDWTLIVVAKNTYWRKKCSRFITLEKGKITEDIIKN